VHRIDVRRYGALVPQSQSSRSANRSHSHPVQIRVSRATLENQPCRSPINLKLNIRTLFSPRFAFLSIPDIEQLGSPLNAVTRHLGETFETGIRYNGVGNSRSLFRVIKKSSLLFGRPASCCLQAAQLRNRS